MKRFTYCAMIILYLVFGTTAYAVDSYVQWNNNAASDNVTFYSVYICTTSSTCVVEVTTPDAATVTPPTDGSLPRWTLPANTAGAVAVQANNANGGSNLSAQVSFSTIAGSVPSAPTGVVVIPVSAPSSNPTVLLNAVSTAQSSNQLSVVSSGKVAASVTVAISGTWVGKIHLHTYDASGVASALYCSGSSTLIKNGAYTCAIPSAAVAMDVALVSLTSGAVTVTALPNY